MNEPLSPAARKEWLVQFGQDLEKGRVRLLSTAIEGLVKIGREDLAEPVRNIFQQPKPDPEAIKALIGSITTATPCLMAS